MPASRRLIPLAALLLALPALSEPQAAYKGHGADSVSAGSSR